MLDDLASRGVALDAKHTSGEKDFGRVHFISRSSSPVASASLVVYLLFHSFHEFISLRVMHVLVAGESIFAESLFL